MEAVYAWTSAGCPPRQPQTRVCGLFYSTKETCKLHAVETKRSCEAVSRSLANFSAEFMTAITTDEWVILKS